MKKLLIAFVALASMSFMGCGTAPSADSVDSDSVVCGLDSVYVDSIDSLNN